MKIEPNISVKLTYPTHRESVYFQQNNLAMHTNTELTRMSYITRDLETLTFKLFKLNYNNICQLQRMQLLKYLAHMGNPMMVARSLLIGTNGASNDYVNAISTVNSSDILSIYACTQINNYSIIDTPNAYNNIPIRYVLDSTLHKGFLQITTRNIITNDIPRIFDLRHPVVNYIKGINGMYIYNVCAH